jgi:putative membrane protein
MISFLGTWLATGVAVAIATWLLPGFITKGNQITAIVVFALVIALVNASVRPLMQALSMPLTIITLGFFHLVVNALALMLASWLTLNIFGAGVYVDGFIWALIGSLIISFISGIAGNILGVG